MYIYKYAYFADLSFMASRSTTKIVPVENFPLAIVSCNYEMSATILIQYLFVYLSIHLYGESAEARDTSISGY